MTLYEHYQIEREEGRKEGRKDLLLSVVESIMSKGKTLEEACSLAGVNIEEYNLVKEEN